MSEALVHAKSRSHTIVYCAAAIACMAVTAWVSVPIGPVPLSLAPLAVFFTLFALSPRNALIAICGYVLLGAIGLPVFTGFRGGLGAVFGPTGGFIMGYVIGAFLLLFLSPVLEKHKAFASTTSVSLFGSQVKKGFLLRNLVVGIFFAAVYYIFGWLWLMVAGQLSAGAAFAAAVAPFVIPDLLKMLLAVFLAQAVGAALRN
ncbi:biotin transporter BioY [Anaerotardibacter muris]|uniref:biotin transporter BioY n=1 Tax=Anaerotardibacter muris TaxID=2941505 RepID=UPI002041C9B9|nr:biotin transporter BioY [Anaerotardibacter muris]